MHTIHDDRSLDLRYVTAIHENGEDFRALDYVIISDRSGRQWLGQILERSRNVPVLGNDPLNPILIQGLELAQTQKNVRSIKSRYLYRILLQGEIRDYLLHSVRVGPNPGSNSKPADQAELFRYLKIPAFNQDNDKPNAIGVITNMGDAPLCWTRELFNTHVSIAGATGCAKSNTGANLILQACRFGYCTILHDPKPDYGRIREKNSDAKVAALWPKFALVGLRPLGLTDVYSIGFHGECDPANVDKVIGLRSSDFSARELSGLFFDPKRGEELQYEAFMEAFDFLKEKGGSDFDLDQVRKVLEATPPDQLNEKTKAATLQKLKRRRRRFPWLDAIGRLVNIPNCSQLTRVEPFRLQDVVSAGRVIRIAYAPAISNQSYGVLARFFLRSAHIYRADRAHSVGLVQYVDEGQRIFETEQPGLISFFTQITREGRSRDHSVILLAQSMTQIPDVVIQNMGSKIVMLHRSLAIAKKAAEALQGGDDFAYQAMGLQTGEALVSLFESRATLLVHMAPSPFELERIDNRRLAPTLSQL